MSSLHEHLINLNGELLKGWIRQMGISAKGLTRKEQFSDLIESELKARLPTLVNRLTTAERNYLAECAHYGCVISPASFQAKYGEPCPQPSRFHSYRDEVSLLTPLIVRNPSYRGMEDAEIVHDLVVSLRALLPAPPKATARIAMSVPTAWKNDRASFSGGPDRVVHTFEGERIGPVELGRVLRLIQGGKIKVTESTERPTEATVRLVNDVLVESDFALEIPEQERTDFERNHQYTASGRVRAHAWPVIAQQCGWAKVKGGALILTETGKELLQQFDPLKFRAGVNGLLNDSRFDELQRISHIRGQTGKAERWISAPGERKRAIVHAMKAFPIGEWLTFKEAHRLVEASGKFGSIVESERAFLYFFEPQYGCINDAAGLRSQYLRAFLMETLATLGLVDIAYVYPHRRWPDLYGDLNGDLPFCGRYDGLLYVRQNPLGAFVLGLSETYAMRPSSHSKLFRVLPNLDLVLDGHPLNPADRAGLELLATPQSEAVWTLDPERILTHIETGSSLNSIREFLETNSTGNLPETVQVFLKDIEAKLGACRIRRDAVLLEWADSAIAQLIATSAGLSRLCHHAGGNRVVVPKEHLTAFTRALKRLGYVLPRE